MCGRYNFTAEEAAEIQKMVQEINERLYGQPIKTGEIYPTNFVPVLLPGTERPQPAAMTWGFPHFKGSGVIINARSETVMEKRMFQKSVLTRRCVVPSTGFFEWSHKGKEKTKYLFRRPGRFVILTTKANHSMKEDTGTLFLFPPESDEGQLIHDRISANINQALAQKLPLRHLGVSAFVLCSCDCIPAEQKSILLLHRMITTP